MWNARASLRVFCLVGLTLALLVGPALRRAVAVPGDVLIEGSPGVKTPQASTPQTTAEKFSVDPKSGHFSYVYPLDVPPGRQGMAPSLSLAYSSSGSMRGGIAAGWDLHVPAIHRDTARGRLFAQNDPAGFEDAWVSTLNGGGRLVRVVEPGTPAEQVAYRAQYDSTYTRYRKMPPSASHRWEAHTTDGKIYRFGETTYSPGVIGREWAPSRASATRSGTRSSIAGRLSARSSARRPSICNRSSTPRIRPRSLRSRASSSSTSP